MSIYNSLDKSGAFAEFNVPLATNQGYQSPAQRKRLALANLGVVSTNPLNNPVVPTAVNASITMTPAQLLAGLITSTSAAAVLATLPLAVTFEAALALAFGTLGVGDGYEFNVVNTGPNTFTINTGAGWTLIGSMAVLTATAAQFRIIRTAANAYTMYRISA